MADENQNDPQADSPLNADAGETQAQADQSQQEAESAKGDAESKREAAEEARAEAAEAEREAAAAERAADNAASKAAADRSAALLVSGLEYDDEGNEIGIDGENPVSNRNPSKLAVGRSFDPDKLAVFN